MSFEGCRPHPSSLSSPRGQKADTERDDAQVPGRPHMPTCIAGHSGQFHVAEPAAYFIGPGLQWEMDDALP
jgi:hypothetical protein